MAEKTSKTKTTSTKTSKKRVVKKQVSVREQAARSVNSAPKSRRLKRSVKKASAPLHKIFSFLGRMFAPLSFLFAPFRTKPVRFVGRFLAKVLGINYIRKSWQELRQVEWPNAKDTFKLTMAVFLFAIMFSLLIAVVDFGLDKVFQKLLLS